MTKRRDQPNFAIGKEGQKVDKKNKENTGKTDRKRKSEFKVNKIKEEKAGINKDRG